MRLQKILAGIIILIELIYFHFEYRLILFFGFASALLFFPKQVGEFRHVHGLKRSIFPKFREWALHLRHLKYLS